MVISRPGTRLRPGGSTPSCSSASASRAAARTSADWFHAVVVPNAQTLLFPNGKTKFVRPTDGSVGKEPGTGVVLIGMGAVANAALERSGLGLFVRLRDAPPYDAKADFAGCIDDCYAAVRERVAAGGKGWTPKRDRRPTP